jgi:hypothetical protein
MRQVTLHPQRRRRGLPSRGARRRLRAPPVPLPPPPLPCPLTSRGARTSGGVAHGPSACAPPPWLAVPGPMGGQRGGSARRGHGLLIAAAGPFRPSHKARLPATARQAAGAASALVCGHGAFLCKSSSRLQRSPQIVAAPRPPLHSAPPCTNPSPALPVCACDPLPSSSASQPLARSHNHATGRGELPRHRPAQRGAHTCPSAP